MIVNAGRQVMDSNLVLVLLVITPLCLADNSATVPMTKTHTWSGNFEGHFILPITHGDLIGWEAIITFNVPVTNIQVRSYLADQSRLILIYFAFHAHICINARNVAKVMALWKCYNLVLKSDSPLFFSSSFWWKIFWNYFDKFV